MHVSSKSHSLVRTMAIPVWIVSTLHFFFTSLADALIALFFFCLLFIFDCFLLLPSQVPTIFALYQS